MKNNLKKYFSGEELYGDGFSFRQIKDWFEDEKEGYSDFIEGSEYVYGEHELNKKYGYNKLKDIEKFEKVLGFGSAYGHELEPIVGKVEKIYIVESSKKLRSKTLKGKSITYIEPNINGKLDFSNNSFDLITCFGVLHHIPNVSKIINEFTRVLKPGGYLLMREPIVSMGDWTRKRKGVTKRERGISLEFFRKMIKENSLRIISEEKVLFPLTRRLNLRDKKAYNSKLIVFIDSGLSKLFSWNNRYHPTRFWHKLKPQSVFYVLRKDER